MSGNGNLTWAKEVVEDEVHRLEYPPVNKQLPDGKWVINYNRNEAMMTADGYRQWTDEELEEWHRQYDPPVPPYVRRRCTKYQLVNCLKIHYPELLAQLRTAYAGSPDLAFYWNTVNDLDRNNADFKAAADALGITDEQMDEIFAKIEGEEPPALEN